MDHTWENFQLDDRIGGLGRHGLNLAVGLAVSVVIFSTLSLTRHVQVEKPPAPGEILRSLSPPNPPPPSPEPRKAEAGAASLLPFPTPIKGTSILAPSPSDSLIRIRATSPAMGPVVRPNAEPNLRLDAGQFKPRSELAAADPNHVFALSEVDQPPVAIFRKVPDISQELFLSVKNPRVTLLFIVTTTGTVDRAWLLRSSGSPEFDTVMLDTIKEWEFQPAVKRGKPVRCWIQQPIVVTAPYRSPFEF